MIDQSEQYYVIRTYSAGVHFGQITDYEFTPRGVMMKLKNATRIHYWSPIRGKTPISLSGLALHGCGKESRIDKSPDGIIIQEGIEMIPVTDDEVVKNLSTPRNHK
jgi:hypothetical protein